jgi:hypothetical protein
MGAEGESMKTKIIKPYVDELAACLPAPPTMPEATPATKLPAPAELDQDAGGGYNTNTDYPQT